VARCCRWPASTDNLPSAREREEIDWRRVVRIARRHQVEALVWNRLRNSKCLPEESAPALRLAAETILHRNLQHARASLRLNAVFEKAGVSVLFLKGIPLGILAYGSLGLKASRDVDLLVAPEALDRAAGLLLKEGYRCTVPGAEGERLGEWHAVCKESVWRHSATGVLVELHTQTVDNPSLLAGAGVDVRQWIALGDGQSLPTFPPEQLFAYLCVHGTSCAWFRLKWLADVGALVSSLPPGEVERLYGRARAIGAGRCSAVALLLCEAILGMSLPAGLCRELRRDWRARMVARLCVRKLTGRYEESEILSFRWGTISIHLLQPFLGDGWRSFFVESRRLMARPEDRFKLSAEPSSPFVRVRLLIRKIGWAFAKL